MTLVLNSAEIEEAQALAAEDFSRPNLQKATLTLARLHEWVNANSDGWAYWVAATTASKRLQGEVALRYFGASHGKLDDDISAANLARACTPIKAFLTKQGAAQEVVFVNP